MQKYLIGLWIILIGGLIFAVSISGMIEIPRQSQSIGLEETPQSPAQESKNQPEEDVLSQEDSLEKEESSPDTEELRKSPDEQLESTLPSETQESVTFLSVGDIMLGRYVETLMNAHGQEYPFAKWDDFYQEQNLVMGNLEGPIVKDHVQTPDFTVQFSFTSSVADLLAQQSFSHLTLANNHTFDQGKQGFEESQDFLDDVEIEYFGHPRQAEKTQVGIETIHEQKIALIGLNQAVSPYFDLDDAQGLVERVRADNSDAVIMIQIHWGDEYQVHSNETQQTIAHTLANAGADFIIGHHPHVVQEVEKYHDTVIFYSLGNFIFDQYFSQDVQEGLALRGKLAPEMAIELIPVTSDLSQPQAMHNSQKERFLTELAQRSDEQLQDCILAGVITEDCEEYGE